MRSVARAALWVAVQFGCGGREEPERECVAPVASTVTPGPGGGGNVLVLLLDDIGPTELAGFSPDGEIAVTPTIDCLGRHGMSFQRAWAAPLCSPGRATLQTGRLADRTGIGQNVKGDLALPAEEQTLAEVLGSAGYDTAYVGKWHLHSWTLPGALSSPVEQGYRDFRGTLDNLSGSWQPDSPEGEVGYDQFWWISSGSMAWTTAYATSYTVDEAITALDELSEPFVMVVAFHAPHAPIHEPPSELLHTPLDPDAREAAKYRAMVEAVDTEMGRLLAAFDPQVLADTTVVLTADNGVSENAGGRALNGQSKGTLFQGGVDVPLLVSGPHVAEPGSSSDAPVHLVDVLPTLAALTGAAVEPEVDGVDLSPLLADPDAPGPQWVRTGWSPERYDLPGTAVRDERYKVILGEADNHLQLYDLVADPGEEVDLYDDANPDPVAARTVLDLALAVALPAEERWAPLR